MNRLLPQLILLAFLSLGHVFGQDASTRRFTVESDGVVPWNDRGFSVQVLADDLLSGASFTSSLPLSKGNPAKLTDGIGHEFIPGSCTFGRDSTEDWIVTFSNLRIAELHEIRVFSSNRDGRACQDYDVAISTDQGQAFSLVAGGVIADQRGAFNLTRVPVPASGVTDLRFTFRNPGERKRSTSRLHSALYEIDAIGVPIVPPSLAEVRETGRQRSRFLTGQFGVADSAKVPAPDLARFKQEIAPFLKTACVQCHGPDQQKGKFRVDTLDPNLHEGGDVDWWLEVQTVLSNHEMPPDDAGKLADQDRAKLIDWLSQELQTASQVRRAETEHTSFRRMTRYEYTYTLQDLLGLPYEFGADLPPETASEEGFRNSSEMLTVSATQFETYRDLARTALEKATVRGKQPKTRWVKADFERSAEDVLEGIERRIKAALNRNKDANVTPIRNRTTAKKNRPSFRFTKDGRSMAAETIRTSRPTEQRPERIDDPKIHLVLPPGGGRNRHLQINLGGELPKVGQLRVRILASRDATENLNIPILQPHFGFGTGNNGVLDFPFGDAVMVDALPAAPRIYQWEVPLSEIQRNPLRNQNVPGRDSTERVSLGNIFPDGAGDPPSVRIHHVEIGWPIYDQWPPASHLRIFPETNTRFDETAQARKLLTQFLTKAWRQPVADADLERMMSLFAKVRPQCQDFQEAVVEVLAVGLASPRFLYLVQKSAPGKRLNGHELATRLSYFLWCSMPDDELRQLAQSRELLKPDVLAQQAGRMLADPRARRFAEQFVHQWLGLEMLDILAVDKKTHPTFDTVLKTAMHGEIIAFFETILTDDRSLLDFIDSDFALINQRLAQHYGIPDVHGPRFQRVALSPKHDRGGLLTQAGVLAMTSNGIDSNPLRRGVWLLDNLLNDPPPPPPPAVPEIDVADPNIMKLTLKERLEQHRDDPACMSCHQRIDPWGIAFENFDAIGHWRTTVNNRPVDSTGVLFNNDALEGMAGLKRYLLENRQDQFAEALVHKLTTFALGRPLGFADRAHITRLTADLRRQGDGLATLVHLIVQSEIFRTK